MLENVIKFQNYKIKIKTFLKFKIFKKLQVILTMYFYLGQEGNFSMYFYLGQE